MSGELPLRVIDTHQGFVIRCLCDAESAVVQPVTERAMGIVRANRGTGPTNRGIAADCSPAAVIRMAMHAKTCQRGHNLALQAGRGVPA